MTTSRRIVRAFYDALISRDPQRIVSFVAEDVDWLIIGPVEIFPFCGRHRGRTQVLVVFARMVPEVITVTRYDQEYLLVDGQCASSFSRITAIQRATGRVLNFRIAQFLRLRDGEIAEFCSLVDTLDAAQQVLGRPIDLTGGAPAAGIAPADRAGNVTWLC
jgi:ketosteroid isomerase-like protein